MIVDDQAAAIAFLRDASSYGASTPVEMVETHISRIFLVGGRAYKMKRAVKLPYADFSTPALRLATCRKEVDLNTRTAPGLYLGVRELTRRKDGRIGFGGEGELIDAVVEMMRFDQECLFDRMAVGGRLTPALMTQTARMIARFHRDAEIVHAGAGRDNLAGVLDINEAGFATSHVFGASEKLAFNTAFRSALARHSDRLDRREKAGKVRLCHGDLHLRNICLLDGKPSLFDCIEFNDQIATVDVLYDLAFLLMDLWYRGLADLANLVMNRYLDESDDEDGFVLLPFFMAVRAAVRAHVTATQVEEGTDATDGLVLEARSYYDLALSLLREKPAQLIAIGGLSGSGKTTIADALAPGIGVPPGARILESDRIRKAMHGVSAETRLPDDAYKPEISQKVYDRLATRAGLILSDGGTVVADAVFDRGPDRDLIEMAARNARVPFVGIWLEARPELLRRRVSARRGGPSDATVEILSHQLARKVHRTGWQGMDAAQPVSEIVSRIVGRTLTTHS